MRENHARVVAISLTAPHGKVPCLVLSLSVHSARDAAMSRFAGHVWHERHCSHVQHLYGVRHLGVNLQDELRHE